MADRLARALADAHHVVSAFRVILKYSLDYSPGLDDTEAVASLSPEMRTGTMEEQSAIHNTFVIERSYPASPERVFAAFADPVKKRRWFGENEKHDVEEFEMDFRVGGAERARYRMNARTPFEGVTIASDGYYQDIVPNRRVVVSSAMSFADKRISAALVTVELLPTAEGTDVILTHQGAFFEGADGPEMREAGWRLLLDRLAAELVR
jgi:uncharacterized protein YndB with AHSA1/START domain